MGDMNEDFEALDNMKREIREKKEPLRFKYAQDAFTKEGLHFQIHYQYINIQLAKGDIVFWPYTGWFNGKKPYGKIKGRGIDNLMRQIRNVKIYESQQTKEKTDGL